MKNLFIFLFLLLLKPLYSQTLFDYNELESHDVGDTVQLLFDAVNLRSEPDTESKIIQTLTIGSQLKIISKSDETFAASGFIQNWFEVVLLDTKLQESSVKGYLWGGFFANNIFESKNDPDVSFLFGLSEIKQEDWGEFPAVLNISENQWGRVPVFQLRAVAKGKEIARIKFEGIGVIGVEHHCELIGNKGLRNVNEIIHFNVSSDYCGGFFGDIYVFWDKASFHLAKTLHTGFDAPFFSDKKLIFPTDEGGKPGIIIFHEEEGNANDDGTIDYDYQRDTRLIWTGSELIKNH